MILWKRAVPLGVLSWLMPFALSFLTFPLKRGNAPLFENLMNLAVLITGALLLRRYFRDREVSTKEAVAVAAMWCALNLILDFPMFAFGPMKMTALAYCSEIGFAYLALPAFAFGAARLARP